MPRALPYGLKSATATVVIAATSVVTVVTAATEQENQDYYPSTTATAKTIITHIKDLLFCLSSHTMQKKIMRYKKILLTFPDFRYIIKVKESQT